MKFKGLFLAATSMLPVHAFNAGVPTIINSQRVGLQRSRWMSMSDSAPAAPISWYFSTHAVDHPASLGEVASKLYFQYATDIDKLQRMHARDGSRLRKYLIPQQRKKRSISVSYIQETPGGFICDVDVMNFKTSSSHRIVFAKEQVEQFSKLAGRQVKASELVTYTIKFMMDKGLKLENTEGMIDSSVFPVNYFTLTQLTYYHDDVEEKIAELCKEAPDLSEL